MEPSLVTALVVAAALAIKTAVLELRDPGSARREWAFLTDRVALAGGALTAVVVGAAGWAYGGYGGYGVVAWAMLAGLLVAQVMGRRAER
ncbi:hypothetical protein [Streptomyces chartreusis]|uniref:Uncharacterized protein n=1 Tax=Streptomyces chartreusis TaxID=1969 RepID=A0A7H8T5Y3_STRCX|nr:hypothetical protein [Streptomyces chartreusis]QKZ18378.1 hypothetical protein HUT05_14005 [Streptomyces chartreusis]